ncbi:YceI family protein [Arthrobacter cupressi]|uniref:Polyisoprenoid-binding protein YceI n=1 Tax=Arthrobacter cupressi TaxID=1045773 RepID=A0A1G8Q3I6_9MICC|nr:YceI family protein [Arthrobacter cupressi]NYD78015.1 polyisoprenoid-binding protein YceI [Arthrobacter cupressi]SDI99287.1 Polyisoprenoid-binding protein YceI [Arthrobacter cupressi]
MAGRKRPWILITVAAVAVLAALAAIFGPQIYAQSQGPAPEPLTVATPSGTASTAPSSTATSGAVSDSTDEGAWNVASGSQAGYRIDEVLNGADVTVVGRTEKVTGSATVSGAQLTAAKIDVDVASIATDSGNRDNYFRGTAMKADTFPTATFTLTSPVTIPALSSAPAAVEAKGTLELAGQKRDVTAMLQVVRDGAKVSVSGTIGLVLADFGITPPDLGFVKVDNTGSVEFLVHLEKAA